MSVIEWKQASVAGVKLRRFTGHVGGIEVGSVEFDGSNRLWTWSSPFAEDVWGHAPTQAGAQKALAIWLRGWLERLRPVLDAHHRTESRRIGALPFHLRCAREKGAQFRIHRSVAISPAKQLTRCSLWAGWIRRSGRRSEISRTSLVFTASTNCSRSRTAS